MSRCDHPDNLHCQTALQPVSYEEPPWSRDPESLALVPKSRCRAIGPTYRASIPSPIVNVKLELAPDLFGPELSPKALTRRVDEGLVNRTNSLRGQPTRLREPCASPQHCRQ